MATEKVDIRVYQDFIPDFIESSLENLYENIFSSLVFLKTFNRHPAPVNTYVLNKDQVPKVVLLFRIEANCVTVVNESMAISAKEIEQFASYIFMRFPKVDMVSLNAIRTDFDPISYPSQRFNCLEDIVVNLPATQPEYLASLSKAMRKNIKRYLNKIQLGLPSLEHSVLVADQIEEQHIRDIIELNKARMQHKQKVSTYDALETRQIFELAKRCGFIRILRLDGAIVAGEVCTRIGNHYFSHVGAHDPRYDDYRLGAMNCYLTICECIARSGKQFHFLWGQYDYKYSLRGVQQDLNYVALYRSHFHLCLNGAKAFKLGCKALARSMKNSIRQRAKQANFSGNLLGKLIEVFQRMKKLVPVKTSGPIYDRQTAGSQPVQKQIYRDQIPVEDVMLEATDRSRKTVDKERPVEACID